MQQLVRRQRWAIVLHSITTFSATTAFKVIASYSAIDLGFGPAELGLLAASFAIPPLLVAFHAGRWTDRIGGLKVTLIGDIVILLAASLALMVPGAVVLILASAALGLGTLLSIVGQHALIGATIPKQDQERMFGTLFSANSVGQMIGPLAATVLASLVAGTSGNTLSVEAGLIVVITLATAGLASFLVFDRAAWRPHADGSETAPPAFRAIGSIVGVKGAVPMLCISAVVVAIIDMLSIFLPAWGAERQVAPVVVGALLSARSAASIVVRFAMMRIIALLGRRNLLVASTMLTAVALAAMPFADLVLAAIIATLLGLTLGLAPPISLAWVSLTMPPGLRGSAMGLRLLANRLAQAGVPTLVGLVSTGVSGMFLASAALVAATSLLVFRVPFAPGNKP